MKNLIKGLLFITLCSIFLSTDFKEYYLLRNELEYIKLSNKRDKEILKRCIVFKSITKCKENFASEQDEKKKTAYFVYLLRKKRFKEADEFLAGHDKSLNIHYLYKGLRFFMTGEYDAAALSLQQYNEENLAYYKYLLLADSSYELQGLKLIDSLVDAYQKAYDTATNDIQKEIVKNRIRYVIYKK